LFSRLQLQIIKVTPSHGRSDTATHVRLAGDAFVAPPPMTPTEFDAFRSK